MSSTRDKSTSKVPEKSGNVSVFKSHLLETRQNVLGRGAFGVIYLRRYKGSDPKILKKCRTLTDSKNKVHHFIIEKRPQGGADLEDFRKEQETTNELADAYDTKYADVENPPESYNLQLGALVIDETDNTTTPAILGQLEYYDYKEVVDENGEIDFEFYTSNVKNLLEEESKYDFRGFGNDANLIMANYFGDMYQTMEDMHAAGKLHLDISLRNGLVSRGHAKLTDYGFTGTMDENGEFQYKAKVAPVHWMNIFSLYGVANKLSDYYACRIALFEILALQLGDKFAGIISLPEKEGSNKRIHEGLDFFNLAIKFNDDQKLNQYIDNVKEFLNSPSASPAEAQNKARARIFLNSFESYLSMSNVYQLTDHQLTDRQMLAKSFDKLFTASLEMALATYQATKDTNNNSLATLLTTIGHAVNSPTSWKLGFEQSDVYNVCSEIAKYPINSNDPKLLPLLIQLQTKVPVKDLTQIQRESASDYTQSPEFRTMKTAALQDINPADFNPEIDRLALNYGVRLTTPKDQPLPPPVPAPVPEPTKMEPDTNPKVSNAGETPITPKPPENPRSFYGTLANFINPTNVANYFGFGKPAQPATEEPQKPIHNSTTDITTKLDTETKTDFKSVYINTGKKTVRIKDDVTAYAPIPGNIPTKDVVKDDVTAYAPIRGNIVGIAEEPQTITRKMSADEIHAAARKNQTIKKQIQKAKSFRAPTEEKLNDLIAQARAKASPELQKTLDTFFTQFNKQASLSLIDSAMGSQAIQNYIKQRIAIIAATLNSPKTLSKEQIKKLKTEQEVWRDLEKHLTKATQSTLEFGDILAEVRHVLKDFIAFDASASTPAAKNNMEALLTAKLTSLNKPVQRQAERVEHLLDSVNPSYFSEKPVQESWYKAKIFQSIANSDAQAKTTRDKFLAIKNKLTTIQRSYPGVADKNLFKSLIAMEDTLDLENHPEQLNDYKAKFIALMHDVINKSELSFQNIERLYQDTLPPQKADSELIIIKNLIKTRPLEAIRKIKQDLIDDKYRFMDVRPDLMELWMQSVVTIAQTDLANQRIPDLSKFEEIFDYLAGKNSRYLKLYQQKFKDKGSLEQLKNLYQQSIKATAADLYKLSKEIFVSVDFTVKNFTKPQTVAFAINRITKDIEKDILEQPNVSRQLLAIERWIAVMGDAFTAHDFQTVQAIFSALQLNSDIKKLMETHEHFFSAHAKYIYSNITSAMATTGTINMAAIIEKDLQTNPNAIPTVDYISTKMAHHYSNASQRDALIKRLQADDKLPKDQKDQDIARVTQFKTQEENHFQQNMQNVQRIQTQLKTNSDKPIALTFDEATKPFKYEATVNPINKTEKVTRLASSADLIVSDQQKLNVQTLIEETQALTADANKRNADALLANKSKPAPKEFKPAQKSKEEHREFLFAHERKNPHIHRIEKPLTEAEAKNMKREEDIQAITKSIYELGDTMANLDKSMEQLVLICKQVAEEAKETHTFRMH